MWILKIEEDNSVVLSEDAQEIVFNAVKECCKTLDVLAPNKFDSGPINSFLAGDIERLITQHLKAHFLKG